MIWDTALHVSLRQIKKHEIGHECHTKNRATSHGHPWRVPKVVGESGEEAVQLSGFVGDSSCALAAAAWWLQGFLCFQWMMICVFIDIKYMTI